MTEHSLRSENTTLVAYTKLVIFNFTAKKSPETPPYAYISLPSEWFEDYHNFSVPALLDDRALKRY